MSDSFYQAARVITRPLPVTVALRFVRAVHRRLPAVQGGMWAVAALIANDVVGVALVGHPNARLADRTGPRDSLEVTRVAVLEGARNACSALYSACARAARGMGAIDMWTFIHADESGHSLRAAGWVKIGPCGGGEWSRVRRPRSPGVDVAAKVKWSVPWGLLGQAVISPAMRRHA